MSDETTRLQLEVEELVRRIETCTDPALCAKLAGQLEALTLQLRVGHLEER